MLKALNVALNFLFEKVKKYRTEKRQEQYETT